MPSFLQRLNSLKKQSVEKQNEIEKQNKTISDARAKIQKEHISLAPPREPVGKCPRCGGNVYKFVKDNKAVFYCENSPKSCFFRIYEDDFFFTSKGKTFTEDILKKLLLCGKAKVSGLKSERTGKKYDAIVSLTDRTDKNGNKKVGFAMEFENKKK